MNPRNPKKEITKKYEYTFDTQRKIIIEKIYGEVRINDILEMLQSVFSDKRYSDEYNLLVDVCDSTPIFKPNQLIKVMKFLIRNIKKFKKNKIAFLTKTPRHVVDSLIAYDLAKSMGLNITFMPFSTYEEAYKWLTS